MDLAIDLSEFGDDEDAFIDDEYSKRSSRLAELKQLATSVYREVWKEYYAWEREECKRLLEELVDDSPVSERTLDPVIVAQAVSQLNMEVCFSAFSFSYHGSMQHRCTGVR